MDQASITEQTRLQVERAQRAAEEARKRCQAAKGGSLRLGEEGGPHHQEIDDDQALDQGAD